MQLSYDIYHPFVADSGATGPSVVITAGVHGDEYEPMTAAFNLIEKRKIDHCSCSQPRCLPIL